MKVDFNLGDTQLIIKEAKDYKLLRNQLAYVLATGYLESGHSMKPIKETVQINHRDRNPSDAEVIRRLDRAWARGQLPWVRRNYWSTGYFGRGYVQITWEDNYKKFSPIVGIDLVADPSKALEPEIAVKILLEGMSKGLYTGKKLSDYITLHKSDFVGARRIVNGTNKAREFAAVAKSYDAALKNELEYGED